MVPWKVMKAVYFTFTDFFAVIPELVLNFPRHITLTLQDWLRAPLLQFGKRVIWLLSCELWFDWICFDWSPHPVGSSCCLAVRSFPNNCCRANTVLDSGQIGHRYLLGMQILTLTHERKLELESLGWWTFDIFDSMRTWTNNDARTCAWSEVKLS
jgi:hypothetical protein